MSGYRRTRAAERVVGVSAGQSRDDRRRVRDAARSVVGELPAAPKRSESRPQRKRAAFGMRIAAAKTPGQKVSAAASFLASALAELPAARADQVAGHTVEQLKNLAEQLLKEASA
ncbi:hypothetical protein ACFY2R_18185 [Micromonospora olivasterospora]|uniref:Uncharacterized protein n=1 Tax=Micromonospora olivasterospora TaxID=1880 RepID=A0A562HU34_MICOL|nr:hypothetical protein [Micromonospora olivasterospora]TWH62279.1 hypothetical protein JD77_06330 [Micromonospora olivasterospora]